MNNSVSGPILHCANLSKSFNDVSQNVEVLNGINLSIQIGERIAVIGASGSGKSTLLHLLGGLDKPSAGEVVIAGQNISQLNESQKSRFRNKHLGFVYQFHHLLPEFTALENVAMPLLIGGKSVPECKTIAAEMLDKVQLSHRVQHKPGELSGGERQRAAIARALVTNPQCVLADEPTGNLDTNTANNVYEMMLDLNQSLKTSFLVVTHDIDLAKKMDKVYSLEDGKLSPF